MFKCRPIRAALMECHVHSNLFIVHPWNEVQCFLIIILSLNVTFVSVKNVNAHQTTISQFLKVYYFFGMRKTLKLQNSNLNMNIVTQNCFLYDVKDRHQLVGFFDLFLD